MPDKPSRKISLPKDQGLLDGLVNRIKLIIRLLGDNRISPVLKLIPIGSALYFIIPDLVLGPVDDAVVIWLATYLFVELCPPEIVDEHMRAIQGLPPKAAGSADSDEEIVEGEIIDGEFTDSQQ
jgi:hypothetical protein